MLYAAIALGLLAAAALSAAGYLAASRRSLQTTADTLREDLATRDQNLAEQAETLATHVQAIDTLKAEKAAVAQDLAVLQSQQADAKANFEQRVEELRKEHERVEGRAREAFKALAGEALQSSREDFMALAKKTFEKEQTEAAADLGKRQQAIESLLKPIRETLDKHSKAVTDLDAKRERAYGDLAKHIGMLQEAQQSLGQEAQALRSALKGSPTVRGRWGELTLERIAEMAGMVEHCDFREQMTIWKGEARQRPDMVVHMPSERLIVVDAKAVGESYFKAFEADSDHEKNELLSRHLRDIESRVTDLSRKAYWEQLERSPDFVVLFLPSESLLHPAVQKRPDLIEWALSNKVVITTPTMLISLLKVVELGWREQKISRNAEEIKGLGQELHSRVATAVGHLENLGKSLTSATNHFNKLVGSIERKVLPQTRRFEALGANSNKDIPADGEVKLVEVQPRDYKAVEE